MSKEYLNGQDLKPEKKNWFESRKNTILLSVLLVLVLALITSLVIILLKSKNKNEEAPSESQSVVVTEQTDPHKTGGLPQADGELPSIEMTQTTPVETCPICGSTDFNAPDSEGYKSCKKCDTKWKENGDKILVVQDGEKTEMPVAATTTQLPSGNLSGVKVGDYIKFGKYEQDNNTSNGKEAIEWLVLDVRGGKAFVISKNALDAKAYDEEDVNVTWETCTLRKWLNNDFYNSAFTSSEKSRIRTTTVVTEHYYTSNDTTVDINTNDKVFLLSSDEAERYFTSDSARMCEPTAYAKAKGVEYESDTESSVYGNCSWLLRTLSNAGVIFERYVALVVYRSGDVDEGQDVRTIDAVRPAMWISV